MTAVLMMSEINKMYKLAQFLLNLTFYFKKKRFGEKTVSVLLDAEESELIFIDHPASEMSVSLKI